MNALFEFEKLKKKRTFHLKSFTHIPLEETKHTKEMYLTDPGTKKGGYVALEKKKYVIKRF